MYLTKLLGFAELREPTSPETDVVLIEQGTFPWSDVSMVVSRAKWEEVFIEFRATEPDIEPVFTAILNGGDRDFMQHFGNMEVVKTRYEELQAQAVEAEYEIEQEDPPEQHQYFQPDTVGTTSTEIAGIPDETAQEEAAQFAATQDSETQTDGDVQGEVQQQETPEIEDPFAPLPPASSQQAAMLQGVAAEPPVEVADVTSQAQSLDDLLKMQSIAAGEPPAETTQQDADTLEIGSPQQMHQTAEEGIEIGAPQFGAAHTNEEQMEVGVPHFGADVGSGDTGEPTITPHMESTASAVNAFADFSGFAPSASTVPPPTFGYTPEQLAGLTEEEEDPKQGDEGEQPEQPEHSGVAEHPEHSGVAEQAEHPVREGEVEPETEVHLQEHVDGTTTQVEEEVVFQEQPAAGETQDTQGDVTTTQEEAQKSNHFQGIIDDVRALSGDERCLYNIEVTEDSDSCTRVYATMITDYRNLFQRVNYDIFLLENNVTVSQLALDLERVFGSPVNSDELKTPDNFISCAVLGYARALEYLGAGDEDKALDVVRTFAKFIYEG